MNERMTELLRFLSRQTSPVSAARCAGALCVSTRTIKEYVRSLNVSHPGAILSSRNGYVLARSPDIASLVREDGAVLPQTTEERAAYITKLLVLNHTSSISVFELCDRLALSYSSIKSLISSMNKAYALFKVKFMVRRDMLSIEGSEDAKRRLVGATITEDCNGLINLSSLSKVFDPDEVCQVNALVRDLFKNNDFYLSDFAAWNMLLHLLIIVSREREGHHSDVGPGFLRNMPDGARRLAKELCDHLEQSCDVSLSESARKEISALVRANIGYLEPPDDQGLTDMVEPNVADYIKSMVGEVDKLYGVDLSSPSFTVPFALHVSSLLLRAGIGHTTPNPLAQQIKRENSILFDMATVVGMGFEERYGTKLPEDEIGFLAMHMGAEVERIGASRNKLKAVLVSPKYRDVDVMLANSILINFGTIVDIIASVSAEDQLSEKGFQVVFTTVPLSRLYAATVILISPLGISSQLAAISSALHKEQMSQREQILKSNFRSFFEPDLFFVSPQLKGRDEVIRFMCGTLSHKGYVDQSFVDGVLRREKASSTCFGRIAIPHSVGTDAVKSCIAVAIFPSGIPWDAGEVNAVFLIATNRISRADFVPLYEALISFFDEEEAFRSILGCTSFEAFEHLIKGESG